MPSTTSNMTPEKYTSSSPPIPSLLFISELPSSSPTRTGLAVDYMVDYMRSSPASDSSDSHELEHTWTSASSEGLLVSESPITSPSLCCSLRMGSVDATPGDRNDIETNHDTAPLEVPYSSSPPDLYASHSGSSVDSRSRSSDVVQSYSASSLTDIDNDVVYQAAVPPTDPHLDGAGDSFGQKLHQLLLDVARERELERLTTGLGRALEGSQFVLTASDRLTTPTLSCSPPYQDSPSCTAFPNGSSSEGALAAGVLESSGHRSPSPLAMAALGRKTVRNTSAYIDSDHSGFLPDDLSPIVFGAAENMRSSSVEKYEPPANFRIIKRPRSYALFKEQEKLSSPLKRRKTCGYSSTHANERIYARRTASIRRADSLRVPQGRARKALELVPTAPASPVSQKPGDGSRKAKVLSSPVPIIAPPLNHTAKLPLSQESLAKQRLNGLLKKEADLRDEDDLPTGICQGPPTERLEAMVGDLTWEDDEDDWEEQIKFEWEAVMGLEAKTREAVVEWLLTVLPELHFRYYDPEVEDTDSPSPTSSHTSSQSSFTGFSSSEFESSDRHVSRHELGENLRDQLQNSPETRFHAVWMFLRYFYLATPGGSLESNPWAMKLLRTGNFLHNVWAIAVACLAISVKFHRDFLQPLIPVFAKEYLLLSSYALTYERLEAAHRDVLSLFDWRLGISPQPIMDELWVALPSLRTLLDFEGGWKNAMERAWSYLFACLTEPDVQRYPISVLTTTALMKGIVRTLIQEYRRQGSCNGSAKMALLDRARDEAEGVFCDIQALIGVSDVRHFSTCHTSC
ncbi:hypothetical protein CVT26_006494 [Gymnopilus dilepis]|uniref:Uncharacterized protein n=1 Tax=Gymnopilus dilepis TaxID=231916 RepID=A0A409W1E0_9AGAR|nr:hypothetical protein CVT26_006494 [Gymnopilus dilepis]